MRKAVDLHRVLVVLPSWVGDVVMATPALRRLRDALPGSFIGGLGRPGADELLAGSGLLDEVHTQAKAGVMTPKHAAAKVRPRRYTAALLLTNSFSTALVARLAFVPRRFGYDRDGRGVLLTDRFVAPKRGDGQWAIVPAVTYYLHGADQLLAARTGEAAEPLRAPTLDAPDRVALPDGIRLELGVSETDQAKADEVLNSLGVGPDEAVAVLNPGGNNPAKRWPGERFGEVGRWLGEAYGCRVLVNGSPAERELCAQIAAMVPGAVSLPEGGGTIGSLKALCARARVMVSNDTGPRHIAAALGTPLVSLFGPTDPRWTTIPHDREAVVLAEPGLDPSESANDHPERCRVDRIGVERVIEACERVAGGDGES